MKNKYTTFIRSARDFAEFASAEKTTIETDLTLEEAREQCANFNNQRTEEDAELGTKMEFQIEE